MITKSPLLLALLTLTCSIPHAAVAADTLQLTPSYNIASKQLYETEIEMFQGETRVLSTPNIGRVAVGSGSNLSASVIDKKEVLLIAKEVGITSLHLWTKSGQQQRIKVTVSPANTSKLVREITRFLSNIPNTKVTVIGENIVVEGELLSDQDLAKIDTLAERYEEIINFSNRIGWEQMVVMEVKVCEFPVSELREMGIRWSPMGGAGIGGVWAPLTKGSNMALNTVGDRELAIETLGTNQSVLTRSLSMLTGINMGLDAQLRMLQQNGDAAILAEPVLSARSGSEATFLAGGKYPIPCKQTAAPAWSTKNMGLS